MIERVQYLGDTTDFAAWEVRQFDDVRRLDLSGFGRRIAMRCVVSRTGMEVLPTSTVFTLPRNHCGTGASDLRVIPHDDLQGMPVFPAYLVHRGPEMLKKPSPLFARVQPACRALRPSQTPERRHR